MKLFDLGMAVLSTNDDVFEIRPVEDFLELLGLDVAKLEALVMNSREHGDR
jgi:hypothetical protein